MNTKSAKKQNSLRDKKIGVIMGGKSREREVSLRSGKKVLESLKKQGFKATGLDVDTNLALRLREKPIDLVFIALHGKFGEDGTIQGLLEILGLPYTGSGVLSSALAMNKVMAKKIWLQEQILTPSFYAIDIKKNLSSQIDIILKDLKLPVIIKPVSEGSSIGVEVIRKEEEFLPVLRKSICQFKDIFVEKFIQGKEVTVGILESNGKPQVLPVLELRSKTGMYDYKAKYTPGMTEFVIPAELSPEVYEQTQSVAMMAYEVLH